MAEPTITVPIKVDPSQAVAGADKAAKGVAGVGTAATKAQGATDSWLKQTASQIVAFNAMAMVGQIKATAMGFIDAAAGANEAKRSMAATSLVLEGTPWAEATSHAAELQGELGKIGFAAGIGGTEMRGAYMAMLEATDGTTASVKQTKAELASAAKIADVFGMSIENVGREISFMHEGTLRTRGQMFQLLKSTGIFGKDVKTAAESWSKMTDADRTKLLAQGLEQVAGKIEKLPPSYKRLVGQVDAVFAGMRKDIGEPITDALVPALQEIIPYLQQSRKDVRAIATAMGPEIAKWVKEGANLVTTGLAYIASHAEQIKEAIASGFETAKSVVDWILQHKEELAYAFGAKAVYGKVAEHLPGVISAGKSAMGVGSSVAAATGLGTSTAAAVGALAGLAVAAAAAAYALHTIDEANQMRKGAVSAASSASATITQGAQQGGDPVKMKRMLDAMADMDEEMMQSEGILQTFGRGLKQGLSDVGIEATGLGGVLDMTREQFDAFRAATLGLAEASRATTDALRDTALEGFADVQQGTLSGVSSIVAAYNIAASTHNQAAEQFAANLLLESGFTAKDLAATGMILQGGLTEFATNFARGGDAVKEALKKFGVGAGGATAEPPKISMSGGQTFKINQDFRDQDPDRVAVQFEKDIGRMVQRRVSASTSSAFGT